MLKGSLQVPGDKSITHRALIFSAFVKGRVEIENGSSGQDCASTAACMEALGLEIKRQGNSGASGGLTCQVESEGVEALRAPRETLDVGNSGTTIRILSGLLAGRPFPSRLEGDESIARRPMRRVINPLEKMGADINSRDGGFAPLEINSGGGGNCLKGTSFHLQVASAQVQTCILLAGLQAQSVTEVITPQVVRDHTRRMFDHMGIPFRSESENHIAVERLKQPVEPCKISVPADISSAAFFMVAAALAEGSEVLLKNVGLNPGRDLVFNVLKQMGARISVESRALVCGEPVADILVKGGAKLNSIDLGARELPSGIDEVPILSLCGCLASKDSEMVITDAEELRHKESDRLGTLVANLRRNGVEIEEREDGFRILGKGASGIKGGELWETKGDHRMAMTGAIASHLFQSPVELDDQDCVDISYPEFFNDLGSLISS